MDRSIKFSRDEITAVPLVDAYFFRSTIDVARTRYHSHSAVRWKGSLFHPIKHYSIIQLRKEPHLLYCILLPLGLIYLFLLAHWPYLIHFHSLSFFGQWSYNLV